MRHVVIVGNGITGTTVARHLRKRSDDQITMVSSESRHFYSRTALMYIYMGHMTYEDTKPYEDSFWEQNKIDLVHDHVETLNTEQQSLALRSGTRLQYDDLVIATGSVSNKFGWPGQDLPGVQGLYNLHDLETLEQTSRRTKRAVIVGGGLIGIEMAEMLRSRNISVTMLVREKHFWDILLPQEEAMMVDRQLLNHDIDLRLQTELEKILAGDDGRARGVLTSTGEEIACDLVGLTVGVHPCIGLARNSGIETEKGILIDETFHTNTPNIYAGGDCAQFRIPPPGRRPIEQVWYTGKMHGEHIASNLTGDIRPYNPGVWFNSAKFMDLEYQTYGLVPAQLPQGHETLYWENKNRAIRINYHRDSRAVTGFNLFGIRGRHPVCEHWIAKGTTIEDVLSNLCAMNFDPEFFPTFEQDVVDQFNTQHAGTKVLLKAPKGLFHSAVHNIWNARLA